jgi:hypothetical protein
MFGVIGGLSSFLREIHLATQMISLDPDRFDEQRPSPR